MNNNFVHFFVAFIWIAGPDRAAAAPIQFVFEGELTGTFESNTLIDEPFVFTAYADTDNISGFSGGFHVQHDSAILDILGQSLDVTSLTRTFVNRLRNRAGFTNVDTHNDIGSLANTVFGSYLLTTSIGPISESSRTIIFSNGTPLHTSGGVLMVERDILDADLSFTATVIPEPASIVLLMLGATTLFGCRASVGKTSVAKARAQLKVVPETSAAAHHIENRSALGHG